MKIANFHQTDFILKRACFVFLEVLLQNLTVGPYYFKVGFLNLTFYFIDENTQYFDSKAMAQFQQSETIVRELSYVSDS